MASDVLLDNFVTEIYFFLNSEFFLAFLVTTVLKSSKVIKLTEDDFTISVDLTEADKCRNLMAVVFFFKI